MKIKARVLLLALTVLVVGLFSAPNAAESNQLYSVIDLSLMNYAFAINNEGQVAGYSTGTGSSGNILFVYEDGNINYLGSLGNGRPYDINDKGQVVGSTTLSLPFGENRGFIYEGGDIKLIDQFKDSLAYALGINNSGQILINDETSGYLKKAFILNTDGSLTHLDQLGLRTWANAINDDGHTVGFSTIGASGSFIYRDGTMENIGEFPPILHNTTTDINNSDQVVGIRDTGSSYVPYLWEDGTAKDLPSLGTDTRAYAINNSGQVVGKGAVPGGSSGGILWENGVGYDINTLIPLDSEWLIREAFDINDSGQIIGRAVLDILGDGSKYEEHDILLTPMFRVTTDLDYYINVKLSDTFSFDYWWEMGQEPEGFNLDILFFSGGEWKKFIGWELNFNGPSIEWETASFMVPEYLRGLETELRFRVFDFGADTDPTVYLRNIVSDTAPVPEPATMLLLGSGLVGLAGLRRRFKKS